MSDARERVLDVAEKLFMDHGYADVSMRDIARVLGVQQAALYYHASNKEELFVAVLERNMQRQHTGLQKAIASAPHDLSSQLTAVARWLVEHMPIDMIRILRSDSAHISPTYASQVLHQVSEAMMQPIIDILQSEQNRAHVRPINPYLLSGMMIGVMNWVAYFDQQAELEMTTDEIIEDVIKVLMHGLHIA